MYNLTSREMKNPMPIRSKNIATHHIKRGIIERNIGVSVFFSRRYTFFLKDFIALVYLYYIYIYRYLFFY